MSILVQFPVDKALYQMLYVSGFDGAEISGLIEARFPPFLPDFVLVDFPL